MTNIIKYELYKLSKIKILKIFIIFIPILILVTGLYKCNSIQNNTFNWRSELLELNRQYTEEISQNEYVTDYIVNLFSEQIEINNFYIENNINPNGITTLKFLDESSVFIIAIIIFMVCIAGSSIANENTDKTLSLLLTSPYKKKHILFGKYLALIILSIVLIVYMFVISSIIGLILFEFDRVYINIISTLQGIQNINLIESLIFKYLSYFMTLINIVTLSFTMSILFNQSTLAILTVLGIQFFSFSIIETLKIFPWYKYIYFVNLDISIFIGCYDYRVNDLSLGQSLLKNIIYIMLFLWLAMYIFERKTSMRRTKIGKVYYETKLMFNRK